MAEQSYAEFIQYDGASCEVKTMANSFLASGNIRIINEDSLEVHNKNLSMPRLAFNREIKLIITKSSVGTMSFSGKVYTSTNRFLRVNALRTLSHFEEREFFRVEVNDPAKLYYIEKDESADEAVTGISNKTTQRQQDSVTDPDLIMKSYDASKLKSIDITVKNISLGGILFVSNSKFYTSDFASVDLPIDNVVVTMEIEVMRVIHGENGAELYGCRFVNPKPKVLDLVCSYLFKRQRKRESEN